MNSKLDNRVQMFEPFWNQTPHLRKKKKNSFSWLIMKSAYKPALGSLVKCQNPSAIFFEDFFLGGGHIFFDTIFNFIFYNIEINVLFF